MRGNLEDLAATGLASLPTLRKWIAAQPDQAWIIKRGSNGDAYEIDIPGAVAAWRAEEDAKRDAALAHAEKIRQLGLDLGLGVAVEAPSVGLSIADRKLLLEEETLAIRLARERGELVSKAETDAAVAEVFAFIAKRMGDFSARLALKVDLPRETLVAIDSQMDADRAEIVRKMEEMDLNGVGSADSGPALEDTPV